MLHLPLLEWKKFRKYTIFRALAILYIILLPTALFVTKAIPKPPEDIFNFNSFLMFPNVWSFMGYIGNWLVFFFLGFIGVLSITSEFANKTFRQNIITGMTRKQFFLSKLSLLITISFVATLYYSLCSLLVGFFHTDTIYMSKVLQDINYIPRYFLMCMGYMTFAMFIGLLLRRTGLALFGYLLYVMAIEAMFRYGVHYKVFKNKSIHFYPMNAVEDLAPMPFADQANNFVEKNDFSFLLTPTEAVVTTCIYLALFLFLCYQLIQKRDL